MAKIGEFERIHRREMLGRTVAGAAAGAMAVSAIAPSALAAEKLSFVTPFRYLIGFSPVLNAHSGGHFKKQGFDSEVIGGNGSASALQQLIAGRAKFVRTGSVDVMKAVANQNVPLLAVSTIVQASTFNVVSPADKPIRSPEDMKGKKIGVVSVGGATENLLNMMLVRSGIDPKSVPRQRVGNSPGAFGLVKQGRISAYIISTGSVIALQKSGEDIHHWSTHKYAPIPSQVYTCTRATAEQEPETVVRFLRAVKASVAEISGSDKGKLLDRMLKDFNIIGAKRRETTIASLEAEMKLWLTEGKENLLRNVPQLWANAQDLTAKVGIARIDDVKALYTNRFIDKA